MAVTDSGGVSSCCPANPDTALKEMRSKLLNIELIGGMIEISPVPSSQHD
jgi:hypothetical protein